MNGGLYFIKRRGWSIPDVSAESIAELDHYTSQATAYILITDKEFITHAGLAARLGNKKAAQQGLSLYLPKQR